MRGVKNTGKKRKATTERIVEAKNATTIHFRGFVMKRSIRFTFYLLFYFLLGCLSVSILDHLLGSIHIDLNATVLLLTLLGGVRSNGVSLTESLHTLNL